MPGPKPILAGLVSLGVIAAVACNPLDGGHCAGVGIPAVSVTLRDPSGAKTNAGAIVVARDGAYADTARIATSPADTFAIDLAWNRGGNYVVAASKPFWTTATQQVSVAPERCGQVKTSFVELQITMIPNAPPVRSVAIEPRLARFSFCDGASQAQYYVDADAGLSKAVTWRSGDTNVVTVTQTGRINVKSKGTTRVFAASVADPSVEGSVLVRVDPTCP